MASDSTTLLRLRALITGHMPAQALHVAAALGIPDMLDAGPLTAEAIAARAGADAQNLKRLMRALCAFGIFTEQADGAFAQTEMSNLLRREVPGSMYGYAILYGGELGWGPWGALRHSVMTGQAAFEHVMGAALFDYLAAHPEQADEFNRAMRQGSEQVAAQLVAAYDFSRFATIVDVGGGEGAFLSGILSAVPGARGVLLDVPHVVEAARSIAHAQGLEDRIDFVAGDFFESVPTGGDVYVLKWIIHDWDDEASVNILRACRAAMKQDARLLLAERVLPERMSVDEETQRAALMDLNMMVLPGGRERTIAEYSRLLRDAGFDYVGLTPTPLGVQIIEAVPAE